MSFGKMNTIIEIMEKQHTIDDDGFSIESNIPVAKVHAYVAKVSFTMPDDFLMQVSRLAEKTGELMKEVLAGNHTYI